MMAMQLEGLRPRTASCNMQHTRCISILALVHAMPSAVKHSWSIQLVTYSSIVHDVAVALVSDCP